MAKSSVVIAPDSFKGTIDATAAAEAIAAGWRRVRPDDDVSLLPQADGGEGTLAALAGSDPHADWQDTGPVTGPDGRPVAGRWVRLGDGRAAAELAVVSGLPLLQSPDPLGASTRGLGEVLRAIAADDAASRQRQDRRPDAEPRLRSSERREILVGLGGSASTDGGAGLLTALGARFLDASGHSLPPGGGQLFRLARVDLSALVRPGPITVLSDVTAPLLGPTGAARVFGPQKGASAADIDILDRGLARLADLIGVDPQQPGLGAAGGTAYALVAVLGAHLVPGAPFVARTTGLVAAAARADVLITGEGRLDATSQAGKTVGHALELSGPHHRIVIAGAVETAPADCRAYSLTQLAGSADRAVAQPARWLREAGAAAAADFEAARDGGRP
ncbi:glycerate kinase [Granulicoccus sp. GXG6511]|uniref:glycerate kinase n=1 Tax=Granulicoccus sp. GXG6511 TaxID=3381351 RepID=UPI003D7EC60E